MLLPIMGPPMPFRKIIRTLNKLTVVWRSEMRTKTLVTLTLAVAGNLASPAYADVVITGKIEAVYSDPSDVVVQLDHIGDCSPFVVVLGGGPPPSSKFFHIQRAQTNFKELTAVALTAFAAGKTMTFFINSCVGDRNIVSHGRVNN
jgi:hypothetical protein